MASIQIEDLDPKSAPDGTDKIIIQQADSTTLHTTLDAVHQSKVGFVDYNDLTTTTTPITHNGVEGFKKLTNDIQGAQTKTEFLPADVTSLWNPVTNQLDFSELSLGDMIDIRVDVDVTTTAINQDVNLQLQLGIGGFAYTLEIDSVFHKAAGTFKMVSYTGFYVGDLNTRDNPGEVQIDSDSSATAIVNGWYIKITRR